MADGSDDQSKDTSVSQFLGSFIPSFIIFVVFCVVFLALRKKQRRVYEARTTVETVPADIKPLPAPAGYFSWLSNIYRKGEDYIIQYTGVDGYFFLRFIALFVVITFVGCLVLWPILFPLSIANGYTKLSLRMFTFGNIRDKWRYFAHVFLSILYFGAVIGIIYKELRYYTVFRHALLLTPFYNTLLSSRTIFLGELGLAVALVPDLRRHFPQALEVWFARDYSELDELIAEREKLAKKYEGTLNKLIIKADKVVKKAQKKGESVPAPANDIEKYIKKRPTHRKKFLIGEKVDTLSYCPERIGELNTLIAESQTNRLLFKQLPAAFVEFPTQLEAQRAFQAILVAKNEFKGARCFLNVSPDDVVWANMNLTSAKRRLLRIAGNTFLTLLIIFWCIPVAVVGAISNINTLTTVVPFLKFINKMPAKIMGIITGLLPVVLLSVLMLLVPVIIRKVGRMSGCLTIQEVESYTQLWFYGFLVVQGFLVMTMTSAATLAVPEIIKDPSIVMSLLANNLPNSSNFYLAYICLQGLAISSGLLAQVVGVILAQILGPLLDSTPRQKWNRWNSLAMPLWSTVYPLVQLLCVISVCYSFVAPLVLGFAFVAFCLLHIAYSYTLIYVMRPQTSDARGRNYASALFQLFVGIYLAELCLVALFVFSKNWACVVIEAILVAATALAHIYFKRIFLPVFDPVPISILQAPESSHRELRDLGKLECRKSGQQFWHDADNQDAYSSTNHNASSLTENTGETDFEKNYVNSSTNPVTQSWVKALLQPRFETFDDVRAIMPGQYEARFEFKLLFLESAYDSPAINQPEPHIWIVKDPMGLSSSFKAHASDKGVDVVDDNTEFNEKGKVAYTGVPPSYEESLRV